MIIYSESYLNIVSTTLVRKLNLNNIKHKKSYRLQWLNDCEEVKDIKQVLCDVVPMHATRLLLGRP
jgi:hypothetical protein